MAGTCGIGLKYPVVSRLQMLKLSLEQWSPVWQLASIAVTQPQSPQSTATNVYM